MSVILKTENLSKAYRLGQFNTGALSLDLERWWASIRGKEDPFLKIGETNEKSTRGKSNVVWSLKDINFEINQGDAVGIIGRNGAGKSTLLKLLSRVTSPTTGSIKIKGRVASLLEVGTGFHPELTGRENVFLNGAILGMRKYEIKNRFDEIIEFAGIQRYVDTPVKRYSSGMYVRLAFAVAAHLESEIFIVDEVLAVGDVEFQKKCLGKMGDLREGEGRTILFVSHNMPSVKTLCTTGILLNNGEIQSHGSISSIVNDYLHQGSDKGNQQTIFSNGITHKDFNLQEILVVSDSDNSTLDENSTIKIKTTIFVKTKERKLHLTFILKGDNGDVLFTFSHSKSKGQLSQGGNKIICTFPTGFLNIGSYYIDIMVIADSKHALIRENDIVSFSVNPGLRPVGAWMGKEPGFIRPRFDWKMLLEK